MDYLVSESLIKINGFYGTIDSYDVWVPIELPPNDKEFPQNIYWRMQFIIKIVNYEYYEHI